MNKVQLNVRLSPRTIVALRAAVNRGPYRLSITQIVERGIELALAELKRKKRPRTIHVKGWGK